MRIKSMVFEMKNYISLIVIFTFVSLLVSGCTSLSVTEMLPNVDKEQLVSVQKILQIGEVRGGEIKTSPMYRSVAPSGTISAEIFTETLYKTLEQSEIFNSVVSKNVDADFRLNAQLISQEISIGYPMTATLFVHYSLIDLSSGDTKWEKSIISIGKSPAEEAAGDRQKKANERTVKENLEKLLFELSSVVNTFK